jgi:hypothetical protein
VVVVHGLGHPDGHIKVARTILFKLYASCTSNRWRQLGVLILLVSGNALIEKKKTKTETSFFVCPSTYSTSQRQHAVFIVQLCYQLQ